MKAAISSVLLTVLTAIPFLGLQSAGRFQEAQTMRERILSRNFSTAQKVLEENRQRNDIPAICLSLENPFLSIKLQAVEILHVLNDRASIKCLVKVLESNQVELLGGSETQGFQARLNERVVIALNTITGLSFSAKRKLSPAEVRTIKAKTKQWLSVNRQNQRRAS